jgi:MFS family permease
VSSSGSQRTRAIRFIVCLGVVSLFADMTYEGARGILGPFLLGLGATAFQVGLIAGGGEMLAAGLRYFSGRFADRTRAYWTIAILGYAVNVIAVPALAFAGNWPAAALLVIAERTGKALRGPARDVLLSGATAETGHGWGFGLHAAMDQVGAVLGPLLAAFVVARTRRFDTAFLWLAIPAVFTLAALLVARGYDPRPAHAPPPEPPQPLPPVFRRYAIAAALLAAGFADFALLAFHFQSTNSVSSASIPLLYAAAMAAEGIAALAFGRLFDRIGPVTLALGALFSIAALPLGFLAGPAGAIPAALCWGIGMGAQDGCLRPAIAGVVSMNKRGNAFGVFQGLYGVAWFVGSALMGMLYSVSPAVMAALGVILQLAAASAFLALRKPLTAARVR